MQEQFGLFVHWGLYALTAYQEQVRARLRLPRADYHRLMAAFNPVRYDPDAWVDLAWQAGMRYICFTAKHHDGFCLWDTRQTDFNIMNTPYKRDVLRLLADACDRRGMKLSLYYSIPDWNHPNAYNPASSHQCPPEAGDQPDTVRYRAFLKEQIRELLTGYGPVYTLFWDIPPHIADPEINAYVRSLQPGILINDRGYDPGDFSTPERQVPDGAWFKRPTEACQSVGRQSWGYRVLEDYYTTRYLTSSIDKVMAMGGSYLLNVGPMADGRIDPASEEKVRAVGDWYNRVAESLTEIEPVSKQLADSSSNQPFLAVARGSTWYLHFYDGLIAGGVTLKPVREKPKDVILLNNGQPVDYAVTTLPTSWHWDTQELDPPYLHLFNLPAESLTHEPVVIKILW
jgi:alpha-L-fucosidase